MDKNTLLRISTKLIACAVICTTTSAHAIDDERVAEVTVKATLPMPSARLGSIVFNGKLWMFGGIGPAGWSEQVHSAQILPDGGLGHWRMDALLPDRRAMIGNGVHVAQNYFYVFGRAAAPIRSGVVEDGRLTAWKSLPDCAGKPLSNQASCVTEHWLYVLGGRDGEKLSSAVQVLDISQPGGPSPQWRQTTALPIPVWFHVAAVHKDRMYVWGGSLKSGSELNPDVFSAELNHADGTLGEWRKETPMPLPVYAGAGTIVNGSLVSVAGRYRTGYATNVTWIAPIQKDGKVGEWRHVKSNMDKRMYHSIAADMAGRRLYVLGGYSGDGLSEPERHASVDTVVALNLSALGLAN
ncbi:MAG: Kelch repeat-containing protein [Candidatus Sumerlaeaceae bacterium]